MRVLKIGCAPGKVINDVVIVTEHGEDTFGSCEQVRNTVVDTESGPVEMDGVDVVTRL